MKPARFEYVRPSSAQEAIDALVSYEGEAKLLAGGQSFVPMLSMRLAQPDAVIDLNRISELSFIRMEEDHLAIGSMTRHRTAETSELVISFAPLMAAALHYVGHATIRNRGTIGGSLAHSDPAAELPAVMKCLEAVLVISGPRGTRSVAADEFFQGFLNTSIEFDEILTEIRIPYLPLSIGWAVEEFARRNGDFAIVSAFVGIGLDEQDHCDFVRITVGGASGTAVRVNAAEQFLLGKEITDSTLAVVEEQVRECVSPTADIQGSVQYRRDMAAVIARRAVVAATDDAHSRKQES